MATRVRWRPIFRAIPLFSALLAALVLATATARAQTPRFDHIYVIVLENHGFDDALFNGPSPFLRELARTQGLATRYFGVAHPSLPNYLALIGGDDFGIRDDRPSCFAPDIAPSTPCNQISGDSLVDQLRRAGLRFVLYAETLPEPGSLVTVAPGGVAGALYVQKHNPLPYFQSLAADPDRATLIKPYAALAADLEGEAPQVALIVPNQCHDGHGLTQCHDRDRLIADFDAFVRDAVTAIRGSKNFSRRSAIVVTFDEGARPLYSDAPVSEFVRAAGGADNHIATIVTTSCDAPFQDATRFDHFSLLATIEDGFGLPRLRKAAPARTMDALFADRCAP
ncbi:alkaline phosphatase family protein [uncultured Rhodoblastus sp.]|uniref:alkaline phosphatase family protein n=1 Tax=uncultured Rhodoblastus sp. TaxID=543037 RepID=UPI0025F8BDD3|nr:alkaline phosphatase family protein [uncultured Rhodoblastus sp.]